ncbi:tetratricopeptide repeat protein [Streptomyces tubercidicus]|uniref:tetratricopeptide repeat protein n=1 Tax=Streptomyces tubercidicus TaxID=47759 RepID=UPI0034661AEF
MVRRAGRRWGAMVARLRWGGQLRAARKAVATDRGRAEADADPRYRLALARSLRTLAELLAKVDRPAEGLPYAEEAVDLCRPLAETELARHRAVLAECLGTLGELLTTLVRPVAARIAQDEAAALEGASEDLVAFYRPLAEADPARRRPALAAALHHQASWLKQHGRREEALPVLEEAIALRRGLAEADAEAGAEAEAEPLRRIALARSLGFLGELLGQLDRPADGLPYVAEAVGLRHDLAAADADPRRGIALALCLRARCRLLLQLDRPAEALPFARESVRLWRRVTESAADDRRYRAGLAVSLHTLGELLAKLDRPAEALPYAEEAVDLHRACVGLLGDHRLAGSLRTLGDVLTALDRPAEAQTARDEATALGDTEEETGGEAEG